MYKTLRHVDHFIAKILYSFRWFFLLRSVDRSKMPRIKNILCIKLWGLGNLTIIYPLILKLKEKYPEANIVFITFDLNKGLLENNGAISKILYVNFSKNILNLLKQFIFLLRVLRHEKIDVVINFENINNVSAFFSYLIQAPIRIGRTHKYDGIFYTHPVIPSNSQHISHQFQSLLEPLGITSSFGYAHLSGTDNDRIKVESLLEGFEVDEFICIHPGTSNNFKGKRCSKRFFSDLTLQFILQQRIPVFFIGKNIDENLSEEIIKMLPNKFKVIDLTNQLTIGQLIELLRRSRLLVSNDTGPAHMAASLGVNVAVLFGPTSPQQYQPLNTNSLVFYKNCPCGSNRGVSYDNKMCTYNSFCLDFSPLEIHQAISKKFFIEQKIIKNEHARNLI